MFLTVFLSFYGSKSKNMVPFLLTAGNVYLYNVVSFGVEVAMNIRNSTKKLPEGQRTLTDFSSWVIKFPIPHLALPWFQTKCSRYIRFHTCKSAHLPMPFFSLSTAPYSATPTLLFHHHWPFQAVSVLRPGAFYGIWYNNPNHSKRVFTEMLRGHGGIEWVYRIFHGVRRSFIAVSWICWVIGDLPSTNIWPTTYIKSLKHEMVVGEKENALRCSKVVRYFFHNGTVQCWSGTVFLGYLNINILNDQWRHVAIFHLHT